MPQRTYLYAWGPRGNLPGAMSRKVLIRGGRNSALVEFGDGYQAVVSRNALRVERNARTASPLASSKSPDPGRLIEVYPTNPVSSQTPT